MSHSHRIRRWLRRRAPQRPWWQRMLYPTAGLVLVVVGFIGWVMPVLPGFLLIPLGLPWLFAFHPRPEDWIKGLLRRCALLWRRIRHRWKGNGRLARGAPTTA